MEYTVINKGKKIKVSKWVKVLATPKKNILEEMPLFGTVKASYLGDGMSSPKENTLILNGVKINIEKNTDKDTRYYLTVKRSGDGMVGYISIKEDTKVAMPLFWIYLAVILIGVPIIVTAGVTAYRKVNTPKAPEKQIASDANNYGDEAIPLDPKADLPESDEERTVFNIYGNFEVNAGEAILLTNPSSNTVYFEYVITDDADNIIYQSDLIPVGKSLDWIPTDYLDAGEHNLTFTINTYDINTMAECRGTYMPVKIIIN